MSVVSQTVLTILDAFLYFEKVYCLEAVSNSSYKQEALAKFVLDMLCDARKKE